MSSFLLSLCQSICFQHISCYPFCSSVTCIFCIFSVTKQYRKHLDMNTQVNKLEMTLNLLTTHKIVSVLENNHVVIGSLTDNITALSLLKLLPIHIITEKNYQQHLHVNKFIDTKAIQVVPAWFGCQILLDHIEKRSFQDTTKYLLLKQQTHHRLLLHYV